jgi:superfamily II DNA/RNA helicase
VATVDLHSDLPQSARTRKLASFSSGAVRVMVATDIGARGIHLDGIGLVIHADPPAEHKAYVHRAGRTARAGAAGVVITLQTPAQGSEVHRLMRRAGVVPLTAAAGPHSPVLRPIAGPPAERVAASAAPRPGRGGRQRYRAARRGRGIPQVRWPPQAPQALTARIGPVRTPAVRIPGSLT